MDNNNFTTLIEKCIADQLNKYYEEIENPDNASGLYDMLIDHVEYPLLKFVMEKYNNKHVLVAKALGISRTTLRKKLIKYKLIDNKKD